MIASLVLFLAFFFAGIVPVFAQTAVSAQNHIVLPQVSVPSVSVGSATPSVLGPSTYYYWIVSNNSPNYSQPAGPFVATNSPATLTSSANITVTWGAVAGVSFYDLLRTTTQSVPSGSCNCAVSIGVAKTTIVDTGAALQSYTVADGNTSITIWNENVSGTPTLECTINGTTGPCGGGGVISLQNSVYLATNCQGVGTPPCYAVHGDVRATQDCGTTASSPTVTSATADFTSADLGKKLWCINNANGSIIQDGTVSAVNSTTSVTSTANSTVTHSGGSLGIGTDDAPTFKAAYSYAIAHNYGVSVACGAYLWDSDAPVFNGTPATPWQSYSISGCDPGASNGTLIVMGPDIVPSGGGPVLANIYNLSGSYPFFNRGSNIEIRNFQITALGAQYAPSAATELIVTPQASNVRIFDVGCTTAVCVDLSNAGQGEGLFQNVNLQNNNGINFSAYSAAGVQLSGQGDNKLTNSIIAYLDNSAVLCLGGSAGQCTLSHDYITENGSGGYLGYAAVSDGSVSAIINVDGGLYLGNGTTNIFGLSSSSSSLRIFGGASITANGSAIFTLQNAGDVVWAENAAFYASGGSSVMFSAGMNASSTFLDSGGLSVSPVPTTNLPIIEGDASIHGTQTAANITPSTGWGTAGTGGAGVSAVSGGTKNEIFTVTAAGTPTANPTVAIVFPQQFWVAPSGGCQVNQTGGTGVLSDAVVSTPTATGVSFTWEGTPVSGDTYIFRVSCSNP